MSAAIIIVLCVLLISFVLFVTGWLRPDIISMLVLISLVITGVISPTDSFQGFSSDAVMAIAGLLVIGKGLELTGVVKWVARRIEKVTGESYNRLLLINSSVPGLLSGFINIVAAASFFIPVILRLCLHMKISPSRVLLPMASVALIGANLTLIGASHNLVVHSLLEKAEGVGFGFFEFTIVGVIFLVAAVLYIMFIGKNLLPDRRDLEHAKNATVTSNLIDAYKLKDRLFEVWISSGFEEHEIAPTELNLGHDYGISLIEVVREGDSLMNKGADIDLQEGDILLVQGREEVIKRFCDEHEGASFMGPPRSQETYPVSTAELAEAVVPPRSPAIGNTPREMEFRDTYGLTVIAYFREGRPYRTLGQDERMKEGDGLLFYGPRDEIRDFDPEKNILIYHKPGEPEVSSKLKKRGPLAAAILFAVILVAGIGLIPISIAALAGAAIMVLSGIINPVKTYKAIDWKTIILIGGMYPLGMALNQTGAADLVGDLLISTLGKFGPLVVMAGVVLLTMILTQPIHNAAVAIIMTPIAINAAELMGSSPRAFCVAVVIACSTTFLLPYGHPAPLMVQTPGKYKAVDYVKFGLPLNILALIVILLVVPWIWPL